MGWILDPAASEIHDAGMLTTGTIPPYLLPNQGFVNAPPRKTAGAAYDTTAQDAINETTELVRDMLRKIRAANIVS